MRVGVAACMLGGWGVTVVAAVACGGAVAGSSTPDAAAGVVEAGGSGATADASAMRDASTGNDATADAPTLFPTDATDASDAGSAEFSCAPASSFFDGGCGDPLTDPHNCGACGVDCDGGACDAGTCAAMPAGALATGQLGPIAIAADGTNVYWLTTGAQDSFGKAGVKAFGAQVLACAATGCGNRPTVLATYAPQFGIGPPTGGTPTSVAAIAVDATRVYWTDQQSVHACALGGCGCAPTTIVASFWQPPGVAAAGGRVFWTEWAHGAPNTGTVSTCAATGCASGPNVLATGQGGPLALTADDAYVYWTDTYEDGGPIWESPAAGGDGGVRLVTNENGNPYGIASDATNLYWTNAGAGTVVQCAKADCQNTRIELASGRVRPSGIATDGASVYWRDGPGDVYRCAVGGCGGSPTLVANAAMSSADFDQAIAVDATRVYWTQQGAADDDWIASAPK
ncbi:MAG TPA: hypothetical protein VIY73_02955 [Polyangiaceae bacterium]